MPLNSVTNYFTVQKRKTSTSTATNTPILKPNVDWFAPKAEMTAKTARRQVSTSRASLRRTDAPYSAKLKHGLSHGDSPSSLPKRRELSSFSSTSSLSSTALLSDEQKKILARVVAGQSLFYTGAAGTGKSFLLGRIIEELRRVYGGVYDVAVTATTGLASSSIGGETIHSWASWQIGADTAGKIASKISSKKSSPAYLKWVSCKVLIIDEISMLDGALLEKLEEVARLVRQRNDVFGGIQVIFTGDFFQLPPVDRNGTVKLCFQVPAWSRIIGRNQMVMTTVFRQKGDLKLINLLNEMRMGQLSAQSIALFAELERKVTYTDGFEPTQLFSLRSQVEQANKQRINDLSGKLHRFNARDTSLTSYGSINRKFDELMAPKQIDLRVGAQVLMIQNKREKNLVNGSRGRVLTFITEDGFINLEKMLGEMPGYTDQIFAFYNRVLEEGHISSDLELQYKDTISDTNQKTLLELSQQGDQDYNERFPVVDFGKTNRRHLVVRESFPITGPPPRREQIAERSQIPLILSYALSIHKAQGQTVDRLVVDLGGVFADGQAYVAVSRATCFDRLQVLKFRPAAVKADASVIEFYKMLSPP